MWREVNFAISYAEDCLHCCNDSRFDLLIIEPNALFNVISDLQHPDGAAELFNQCYFFLPAFLLERLFMSVVIPILSPCRIVIEHARGSGRPPSGSRGVYMDK